MVLVQVKVSEQINRGQAPVPHLMGSSRNYDFMHRQAFRKLRANFISVFVFVLQVVNLGCCCVFLQT